MIIVSDSSPLIGLAVCDKLDLLPALFDEVIIPEAVYNEVTVPGKRGFDTIAAWSNGKVVRIENTDFVSTMIANLDRGESEAIALYWEKKADYLLIDEIIGRSIARANGINIIGTAGILTMAKEQGLIAEVKSTWFPHFQ
ncbi:DUF3368 domain-containing protein [Spirochaetia bacterium]|nr:DUF3368 domain-containing protein [Spirochaetia bacterium]